MNYTETRAALKAISRLKAMADDIARGSGKEKADILYRLVSEMMDNDQFGADVLSTGYEALLINPNWVEQPGGVLTIRTPEGRIADLQADPIKPAQ